MEEREMSFGLFCNGLMRGGRSSNRCGRPEGYKYSLGPNGQLWVALPPLPKQ
jgi:hypothetical protein